MPQRRLLFEASRREDEGRRRGRWERRRLKLPKLTECKNLAECNPPPRRPASPEERNGLSGRTIDDEGLWRIAVIVGVLSCSAQNGRLQGRGGRQTSMSVVVYHPIETHANNFSGQANRGGKSPHTYTPKHSHERARAHKHTRTHQKNHSRRRSDPCGEPRLRNG